MNDRLTAYNAAQSGQNQLDLLLCVLPTGIMDAEGFNHAAARNVPCVQDYLPRAAVHEISHSLGLYEGTEQYKYRGEDSLKNRVQYNKGVVVEGVTAFNPGISRAASMDTPFSGRLHHYPYNASYFQLVFDLMGAEIPIWIIPSSLNSL